MREQRLIDARDQLLAIARQEFESNVDVVGLFVAGSLAAGSHDAYSDIDLRVVVKPEKQQWFIEHRREIPRAWPGFLFNEWRPGTRHCVSHFRSFVKIDIFYFGENDLQPSPWHALPITILLDCHGAIQRMVRASEHLEFDVTDEDLDFSISKALAATHAAENWCSRKHCWMSSDSTSFRRTIGCLVELRELSCSRSSTIAAARK